MRKEVTAFIRELLLRHDCVIVPGFGGFIGNYMPAHIEKSSSTFFPPVKQISFNRNLNSNDGLLIGMVSSSLGLNYGDARNLVSEYVYDVKKKLTAGESVTFDTIGTFTLNSEGNPIFEPDRSSNFLLSSFGLDSFHLSPAEQKQPLTKKSRTKESPVNRSASLRRVMWRAAVVVPLAAAMIFVPLKYDLFKGSIEKSSMNPLLSAQLEENMRSATDEIPTTAEPFARVAEEPATGEPISSVSEIVEEKTSEEIASPSTVTKGLFKIIAGSFRSEANALRLSDQLTRMGYNPELRLQPNGFYRVAMCEFTDHEKAIEFTKEMSNRFPDLWISRAE